MSTCSWCAAAPWLGALAGFALVGLYLLIEMIVNAARDRREYETRPFSPQCDGDVYLWGARPWEVRALCEEAKAKGITPKELWERRGSKPWKADPRSASTEARP